MGEKFKTFNLLVNQQSLISQFEENLKETLNLLTVNESLQSERSKSSKKEFKESPKENKSKTEITELTVEEELDKSKRANEDLKKRIFEITKEKSLLFTENEKLKKKVHFLLI